MSVASTTAKVSPPAIAEWFGIPTPCRDACADALPMCSLDVVGIVVAYLRSIHARVYDLKAIQQGYGEEAIEAAAGGPVHELPMPVEFEALLHMDLVQVLGPEDCACFPGKQKICELFSVYFKPPNLSPNSIKKLAQGCGEKFCRSDFGLDGVTNTVDPAASWLLFPDEPLPIRLVFIETQLALRESWRQEVSEQDFEARAALLPKGAQAAGFGDASYCIFTRAVCSGRRLLSLPFVPGSSTFIFPEMIKSMTTAEKITLGGYSELGLFAMPTWWSPDARPVNLGLAPLWKVSVIPSTPKKE